MVFGVLEEELLRDRIVVGIHDKSLSQNLQATATLTLKDALDKVRTKEMITKQSSFLSQDSSSNRLSASADVVRRKPSNSSSEKYASSWSSKRPGQFARSQGQSKKRVEGVVIQSIPKEFVQQPQ